MKKTLILIGLGTVLLAPVAGSASTCTSPTVREAFNKAEVVFAGRVVSYEETAEQHTDTRYSWKKSPETGKMIKVGDGKEIEKTLYITQYEFVPIKIWKGSFQDSYRLSFTSTVQYIHPYRKGQNLIVFSGKGFSTLAPGCSIKDIGDGTGYVTTLLLDQLAKDYTETLGIRTPDNTLISVGMGIPPEEQREEHQKILQDRLKGAHGRH